MTERVCVVHAGTHKTGTTSLQYFLQTNQRRLREAGMLFPSSGWYGVVPGQHAVAWELIAGTPGTELGKLREELASWHGNAVLSSEEFSLFHDQPERLAPLLAMLRELGYAPKILLYVRARGEFAESVYVEQVKHGAVRRLRDVLAEIVTDGIYRLDGRNVPFRYADAADRFARMHGVAGVMLRPYARYGDTMAIFYDFLTALQQLAPSFALPQDGMELAHPRINESLNFGAVLGYAFLALHPEIGLPDDPAPFFAEHAPDAPGAWLGERYALLTREEHLELIERFADDDRAVAERYGTSIPGTRAAEIASADASAWERARIERAIYDRSLERWL